MRVSCTQGARETHVRVGVKTAASPRAQVAGLGALHQYGARDASEKKTVQKVHSQVYAWAKKYELVTFKGSKMLIFKGGADGDGETLALDQAQVVSHHTVPGLRGPLLKIHIDGGHCKARTFMARIKTAHGKRAPLAGGAEGHEAGGRQVPPGVRVWDN